MMAMKLRNETAKPKPVMSLIGFTVSEVIPLKAKASILPRG
jgi:hypothetical protein